MLGAIAALSMVAAEALWFLRPWALRACVALVLALAAWMLLPSEGSFEAYDSYAALLYVGIISLVVFLPALLYVRRRSARWAMRSAMPASTASTAGPGTGPSTVP